MKECQLLDYEKFCKQIKDKMSYEGEITESFNLIEGGLDSLKIMRLVNTWRKSGYKVTFSKLIAKPFINEWWKMLQENKIANKNSKVEAKNIEAKNMNEPFQLTDVQYAYWIGRQDDQSMGGRGCHAYIEFDGKNVDPNKLESAWNKLINSHPMLRAQFLQSGQQKVVNKVFDEKVILHDLRNLSNEEIESQLESIRNSLSHRKLNIEEGHVAGLELSLLPDNKTRIHFDIDLLVCDVQSMQIIFRDLAHLYEGHELSEGVKDWNFAQYLHEEDIRKKDEREKAKKYWTDRLEELPKAPALPLNKMPEEINKPVFKRRTFVLKEELWQSIKESAASFQVTPAMVLLTAYAEILNRYSSNSKFFINIPLFDRETGIKDIEDVVADFTNLLLLEIDATDEKKFTERLQDVKEQFYKDVSHSSYSGVAIQRDLARIHNGERNFAPVVFACNLGCELVNEEFKNSLGNFNYMISQTPQVWLDFQIYEMNNELMLAWDAVEGLFPENLIDNMFSAYGSLISNLAKDSSCWEKCAGDLMVIPNLEERKDDIPKILPEPTKCLHESFFEYAKKNPDKIALIDEKNDIKLSYGKLAQRALKISSILKANNIEENMAVGITLPRGIKQIECILGILSVGAYYVPISVDQPESRRVRIHKNIGINHVISDTDTISLVEWPENTTLVNVDEAYAQEPQNNPVLCSPNNSAYIILTSGSTGEPKGVEVSHYSAWNTISALNEKYHVCDKDKALCVSAIDFDLSVYDMFGILGAGGTLIIVNDEERRNAKAWLNKILKYEATIWNSVPILLDMLLVTAQSENKHLPLRLVMLSGDWIGLDIPGRLDSLTDNCTLIAMGGATEAAIWSNIFEVSVPIPSQWKSIPYGRALPNQAYRVVDEYGRDCPDYVPGELWIGGAGVAKGYRGNDALTKEKFVTYDNLNWYKTGDLGRFLGDKNIEFLGRKDYQVKIRGHRIELGEIESALRKHDDIDEAIVLACEDNRGSKHLIGYVTTNNKEDSEECKDIWNNILDFKAEKNRKHVCKNIREKEARDFWGHMEKLSLAEILKNMNDLGLFIGTSEKYSYEQIIKISKIANNYEDLLKQWLDILVSKEVLKMPEENVYESTVDFKELRNSLLETIDNEKLSKDYMNNIVNYVNKIGTYNVKIITGENTTLEIFFDDKNELSIEEFINSILGIEERNLMAGDLIKAIAEKKSLNKKVKILELGARSSRFTKLVLDKCSSVDVEYTCSDSSSFFINNMRRKYSEYSNVDYKIFNIDKEIEDQDIKEKEYDIIISCDSLHRAENINNTLDYVKKLLAPGGIVVINEMTINNDIQKVTTGYLEEGFTKFQDERKESKEPLISEKKWINLLKERDFINTDVFTDKNGIMNILGQHIMVGQISNKGMNFDSKKISEFLKDNVPSYMVPTSFVVLDDMPLTANGKINRKALPKFNFEKAEDSEKIFKNPESEEEKAIANIWCDVFNLEKVSIDDNYFELGGDSLTATKMTGLLRDALNVEVPLTKIFENNTIEKIAKYVCEVKGDTNTNTSKTLETIVPDKEKLYEPFPLTDVQYSYWIGRKGIYSLGQVSTHCYFELQCDNTDINKVEKAWQKLINHHHMMRCVISDDGTQRILENVPDYKIDVLDLRNKDAKTTEASLRGLRKEMSHQVIEVDKWPLFDVRASQCNDNDIKLHISFDNLIFDGWSMFHILSEWNRIYKDLNAPMVKNDLSFRDYVLALEKIKQSDLYKEDLKYWTDRLEDIPQAPQLPLDKNPEEITNQRFSRLEYKLNKEKWAELKIKAKANGITLSGLLLTAYSEVLGMWSKSPRFTINLTQFNRLPVHEDVNSIVGDFTTLTLLTVNNKSGKSFLERSKNLQKQLLSDLDHPYAGGVQVQRELSKLYDSQKGVTMPIVFTSGIGINKWNKDEWLGKLVYNITQTPQVWLDHQAIEQDDELLLIWDYVEELFPTNMINEMFESYCDILNRLAKQDSTWTEQIGSLVQIKKSEARIQANNTEAEICNETLNELFVKSALEHKDNLAVISEEESLTYKELLCRANYIGYILREKNVKCDDLIPIVMEKCSHQIVAALGILMSGAAYVPIDPEHPKERIEHLIKDSEAKVVITVSNLKDRITADENVEILLLDQMSYEELEIIKPISTCDNLAYIIYTSGSTGKPKGVMIEHKGAVNTILDINNKFNINEKDKAIALSNMNFDLSVYDIFGLLLSGGAIVMPKFEKRKDPEYWFNLIKKEKITVWNTVPAFMSMLMEYMEDKEKNIQDNIRVVLLSGDWIPLDLPDKIKEHFNTEVISLGGATEASIWSNYYKVGEINSKWKSIPYGKPLTNQKFYILNELMMECPKYVPGKLYIAGRGLSRGYYHDEVKTNESFIAYGQDNERIYCTGDLGRYIDDGNMEFLGREDSQVKVGGYRIELGEIESALKENEYVENAIAISDKSFGIAVAILANRENGEEIDELRLITYLNNKIPRYLIPNKIMILENLPLTINGKIDRKKIKSLLMEYEGMQAVYEEPKDDLEKEISIIWGKVLQKNSISRNDDFFVCGGDSLKAVRIVNEMQKKYSDSISLYILFKAPTIALLAEKIKEINEIEDNDDMEEGTL